MNDITELTKELTATDFIEFIRGNPDIFLQHPELLEIVNLSDDRGTSSLLEKQVTQLKGRLHSFQSHQSELIDVVRENEQIDDSFTEIICQLIGFENLSEFASAFPLALRKTFDIDEVSFKTAQAVTQRPSDQGGYDDTLRRLINHQAVCDNRWPQTIMSLFFSDTIKSAALIPMRIDATSEPTGILALGSTDPERYTNELGTAHLNRLGIMSGLCLARLQPSA